MKKFIGLFLTICMLLSAAAMAEPAADTGILPAIAGEDGTTYVNLFEVIVTDEWTPVWQDYIGAVMGKADSAALTAYLQGTVTSDIYGAEAAEAFAEASPRFDCWFINGARSFTFEGDTVTVLKDDGTSETHTYEYLGQYEIGADETMNYMGEEISLAFPCDVYKSTDEAGEFNYFFMRDDTMDTTWHTEFRYGSDLEALQGYLEGPYGYWLAAGIDAEADEETIRKVIALFCLENMDYSSHSEAALGQLKDLGFIGAWKADLSEYGDDYAAVDLRMTIDENGHGETTMNGESSASFEAYALDSGEKGDGEGLYVAYSLTDFEAEGAPYTFTTDEEGRDVLTFIADDGTISWVRQDADDVIEIATAEELAAINDNPSGNYALTADIDLDGIDWTPLGVFVFEGETEEEQVVPNGEYAFTGTFDGRGHTISNLTIDQPEGYALGLFGCLSGARVGNFTLENAQVGGMTMVACAAGYGYMSEIHDVTLNYGQVKAYSDEMSGEGMYGGILGAGMGSTIANCAAQAEIVLPDSTANAGIVGGGLELTSVIGCRATGTITAGKDCYGLGGVSGCGFGAPEFTDDIAADVTITAGEGCYWIGGVTGYAGGYADEAYGTPVTVFTNCRAENVTVNAAQGAEGIGDIVGSGFFHEALAANGAPFDQPTQFELVDCSAEPAIAE